MFHTEKTAIIGIAEYINYLEYQYWQNPLHAMGKNKIRRKIVDISIRDI